MCFQPYQNLQALTLLFICTVSNFKLKPCFSFFSSRFLTEEQFTILENEISEKSINNKYVYLAGDTNSRVASMNDYVPSDPHLDNIFDVDYDIRSTLDKHKILESLSQSEKESSR